MPNSSAMATNSMPIRSKSTIVWAASATQLKKPTNLVKFAFATPVEQTDARKVRSYFNGQGRLL